MSAPSKEALAAAQEIAYDIKRRRGVWLGPYDREVLAEAFDAFARPLMVDAFKRGFAISGEGWNGEYPATLEVTASTKKNAEEWVTARLTAASPERPQDAQKG